MLWLATSVLLCSLMFGLHLQVRDCVCFMPESNAGIVCIWQLALCAFVIFIVLYLLVVNGFNLVCSVDEYFKLVAESIHVCI